MARPGVMVDVDKSLAKGVRVGVLEERLDEDQAVLLCQSAEVSDDRPKRLSTTRRGYIAEPN